MKILFFISCVVLIAGKSKGNTLVAFKNLSEEFYMCRNINLKNNLMCHNALTFQKNLGFLGFLPLISDFSGFLGFFGKLTPCLVSV